VPEIKKGPPRRAVPSKCALRKRLRRVGRVHRRRRGGVVGSVGRGHRPCCPCSFVAAIAAFASEAVFASAVVVVSAFLQAATENGGDGGADDQDIRSVPEVSFLVPKWMRVGSAVRDAWRQYTDRGQAQESSSRPRDHFSRFA